MAESRDVSDTASVRSDSSATPSPRTARRRHLAMFGNIVDPNEGKSLDFGSERSSRRGSGSSAGSNPPSNPGSAPHTPPRTRRLGPSSMFGQLVDPDEGKSLQFGSERSYGSRRGSSSSNSAHENGNTSPKDKKEENEEEDPKEMEVGKEEEEEKKEEHVEPAPKPRVKMEEVTMEQTNKVLIKGGTVVNDDRSFSADVYVEDGIIAQIGHDLSVPDDTIAVSAEGKLVIPGGIDTHTHLQFRKNGITSVDDFAQGTKAAAAGGTTMIIDCVLDNSDCSLVESYDKWRAMADDTVVGDYALNVAITKWDNKVKIDMEKLVHQRGVNAFLVFMSYKDKWQLTDSELYQAFCHMRDLGALALVHAENGDVIQQGEDEMIKQGVVGPEGHELSRPEEVEAEAVQRAITIADQANCPLYVVRVMSKGSADVIAECRKKGYVVFGEPIAASLGTDGTQYWNTKWREAAAHVTSPPLRPDPTTPGYLMDLLANGDLQVTGSAHCSWTTAQRAAGQTDFTKIPHGVNGIEERMSIVWENGVATGKMDENTFVAVTSTNAAKIFNLYPRKGKIAVDSDADIVIWDPEAVRTVSASSHHQASDVNIFEGMEVHGVPVATLSKGKIIFKDDQIVANSEGHGVFVDRKAHCDHIYGRLDARAKYLLPRAVIRMEHDGPVAQASPVVAAGYSARTSRPRNLHASQFTLSGDTKQGDEDEIGTPISRRNRKPATRVNAPPGGRSSLNIFE
ncbi:dihydropyrimidinase-like [Branchiostoma floridae]|uniref:dihydropyrimidinase n=1 Tax=Branchiostoma floridae TaxID=7739 RepID=A0A9J7HL53_BRAFL|nr:dihydropyrimidinase-like [Branchiostoma floridae]